MLAGIFQLALLRQLVRIERAPPRLIGPAPNADADRATFSRYSRLKPSFAMNGDPVVGAFRAFTENAGVQRETNRVEIRINDSFRDCRCDEEFSFRSH